VECYSDILDYSKNLDYHVNSFEQLGWSDPYTEELCLASDWKIPKELTSLAYSKCRLKCDCIPQMIYVPRKDIMFKLMRACIKVKDPS